MKFKKYIKEAKQVGTIYHFTDVIQFVKIVDNNFKMYSYNGVLSCTRNGRLAEDPLGDISKAKGHVVRFNIDGNKLSNKYIIKPIRGYTTMLNPLKKYNTDRVPLDYQENEEIVYSKNSNYVNLKSYLKSITVSPIIIEEYDIIKNIEKKINIPIEFVKKFNKLHEDFNTICIDKYELEVII